MSAVAGNAGTSIGSLVMQRWREIDPLLPVPGPLPQGCGAEFIIAGGTGDPAAAATCEHFEATPGSLDAAWGTARKFQLALVARLHTGIRAAGVPVTLLHYEQVNPLSAPFWSQQGYRSFWLIWAARPACAIR